MQELEIIRNDINEISLENIRRLAAELRNARTKHPNFAEDYNGGVNTAKSEMFEWASKAIKAVDKNGRIDRDCFEKADNESWHVITTMLRQLNQEYLPECLRKK